eukprot:1157071-Karenia_brevis.AAC.1
MADFGKSPHCVPEALRINIFQASCCQICKGPRSVRKVLRKENREEADHVGRLAPPRCCA